MLSKVRESVSKTVASVVFLIVAVLGSSLTISAQQTAARPDRGVGSLGSYAVSDIESINLTNGNLNLSIPLASLPPIAGGRLSFGMRAVYNSKLWNVVRNQVITNEFNPPIYNYVADEIQLADQFGTVGWRIASSFNFILRDSRDDFDWVEPTNNPEDPDFGIISQHPDWHKWFFITPDGAEHELKPLGAAPFWGSRDYLKGYYWQYPDDPMVNAPMTFYSYDGSFIWAKFNNSGHPSGIRWEVCMPDGTRIYQRNNGVQKILDPNGNKIKIYTATDGTTRIQDELTGREIKIETIQSPFTKRIWYQTVGGTWVNVDVKLETTQVYGKTYYTSVPNETGGSCTIQTLLPPTSIDVVKEIVLPQTEIGVERKFEFKYNSDGTPVPVSLNWWEFCDRDPIPVSQASAGWGALSEMKLPSGAKANYTYSHSSVHELLSPDDIATERVTTKTLTHDGTTDVWDYSGGNVVAPDGSVTTEFSYPTSPGFPGYFGGANGLGGLSYKTDYSGKRIVERRWVRKMFNGANDTTTGFGVGRFNPVMTEEYTTLVGNPSKMSARVFEYDFNGNVTKETQYDWFDPSIVQREGGVENLPLGVPASATKLRVITYSYHNDSTDGSSINVYAKRTIGPSPDYPPEPLILNAPKETTVGDGVTTLSKTRFHYDDQSFSTAPTRGNVTKERRDLAGNWIDTSHSYDQYGNRTSTTTPSSASPNGNVTTFVYLTDQDARLGLPNRIEVDPLNSTGVQSTSFTYDFSTGLVTSQTDANGKTTTISYTNQVLGTADPFGRPGIVTGPAATSTIINASGNVETFTNQNHTAVTKYFDNARQVETISDLKTEGDGLLKGRTTADEIGRVTKTETSENGSSYTISSESIYVFKPGGQNGTALLTRNAHRSGTELTDGWTRSTQDVVGRTTEVATFSTGSTPPNTGTNANWTGSATTVYDSIYTTVTDQAGKKRRSVIDGLGRLVRVDEPDANGNLGTFAAPAQPTMYSYDSLGNLRLVQQGTQQRFFTYDSLSRLIRARNPEQGINTGLPPLTDPITNNSQWSMGYSYDDASNLTTRTNPNGTTIGFTYDGLDRVVTKTLSTGSITWTYSYDSGTNRKGRLVSVTKPGGDGYFYDSYDATGRVTASRQITDGNSYSFSYGYDVSGNLTRQVYPSLREVFCPSRFIY